MYEFPKAVIISCHKLGGLKEQKLIFSQFWRLASQNQDVSRVGSFWRLGGRIVPCLSPSFWWLLAVLGILWLVNGSLQSLLPSLRGRPPCVSVCSLLLSVCSHQDMGHWI